MYASITCGLVPVTLIWPPPGILLELVLPVLVALAASLLAGLRPLSALLGPAAASGDAADGAR